MGRKWALPIPMHLAPDDYSAEACELRLHLYQFAFNQRRGNGFRQARGTSPKRKHPRRGWGPVVTRIDTLYAIARYGERQ